MKKCIACGFENDDNSNFCAECCGDKFEQVGQPSKKGGLNIGDSNAIDTKELIGHKEEIHGKKEEIYGNKEEINAQNYTVNQTIVNQTTTLDAEVVELEKQKRLMEMERIKSEMEKMKSESALLQAQAKSASLDASSKEVNLKSANDQALREAELLQAIAQREQAIQMLQAGIQEMANEFEMAEQERLNDKSESIDKKRQGLINAMDSAIYNLESASKSTLSGEIANKSCFMWAGISIALFIIAAATTIPIFWLLLITTIVLTVVTSIKRIKVGRANANSVKKDEFVRAYQTACRDLKLMNEYREDNKLLILDYDKRLTISQANHQSGVKSDGKKAIIIIAAIITVALAIAIIVAKAAISSTTIQ